LQFNDCVPGLDQVFADGQVDQVVLHPLVIVVELDFDVFFVAHVFLLLFLQLVIAVVNEVEVGVVAVGSDGAVSGGALVADLRLVQDACAERICHVGRHLLLVH